MFDHWKVVFSWGKMRKSRFSQNPLTSRFWAFGFLIYTSSSANFKKDPLRYIFFVSVHVPATSETEKDFVACFIDEQYDSAKVSLSLFVPAAMLKQESQVNCGWTESKCPPLKAPPASRKLTAAGFTGAPNISPIFHNLGPSLLSGSVRTFNIEFWINVRFLQTSKPQQTQMKVAKKVP